MTSINPSMLARRSKAATAGVALALGTFIANPIGLAPAARAQSAMDQLYDAAGGNENHEFDGSPHNDDRPPANTPSVPDPGSGGPVSPD